MEWSSTKLILIIMDFFVVHYSRIGYDLRLVQASGSREFRPRFYPDHCIICLFFCRTSNTLIDPFFCLSSGGRDVLPNC